MPLGQFDEPAVLISMRPGARKDMNARPATARAVSLSALTGDGSQMIIASSSISPIPITSTAIATGS